MTLPPVLQYQKPTAGCIYLGLQVGSTITPNTSWNMATTKLLVRLKIACQKVMTVNQCSLIAGAVIIPNLLYIARHEWPTTADVNDIDAGIRNCVWHGQFVKEVAGARAWLNADLAALPRAESDLR